MREVASRLGLHVSTVSLALRGVGRISAETRAKVAAAAKELGYEPNPLFSQAFSLARQTGERYRENLALIIEWEPGPDAFYQRGIVSGALQQAACLGYKLESFVVSGKPEQQRRVGRTLRARGIRGMIIVPRIGNRYPRLQFDWSQFAAVEIGRTLWHPLNLPQIETAGYTKILESLHLLKRIGYRRIGMAVEPGQNRHQNGIYWAAYLLYQENLPTRQRIPIFGSKNPWDRKNFLKWAKMNKPDILYIHASMADEIRAWLKEMDLRVPADVSLFCTNVPPESELTGLQRDYAGMGRAAVEMVSILLQTGALGLSEHPRCLQIDEVWRAGETLSRPIDGLITEEGFLRQKRRPLAQV